MKQKFKLNSMRAMDELPGFESLPEVQTPCRFTGFLGGLANQSCHAARLSRPDHIAGTVRPDSAPSSGTQDDQYGVLPVDRLPDFHGIISIESTIPGNTG